MSLPVSQYEPLRGADDDDDDGDDKSTDDVNSSRNTSASQIFSLIKYSWKAFSSKASSVVPDSN